MSGLFVQPLGSNRTCWNLSTNVFSGTPYCRAREIAVAKLSIRPLMVDPSFAIRMKISPGVLLSSNRPTVMYPSWPPTENLCVRDWRSSGSLRRSGRASGSDLAAAFFPLAALPVFSGCTTLEPSL